MRGEPKTVTAFRWTVEELFDTSPGVYFWTSTMIEVMPAWYVPPAWRRFTNDLVKKIGKFKAVRVFQWHVNHGLHIHWLTNVRIPVRLVRSLGQPYGFGRVNVKRADRNAAKYLSRYLGKDMLKMPGGGRAWARFGGTPFGTRVRDVREVSERSDYIRVRMKELRSVGMLSPFQALQKAGTEYDSRLAREWLEDVRNTELLRRGERLFYLDD